MKQINSSTFRTQFHQLGEPHEVVVLGRVIGIWTPVKPTPVSVPELTDPTSSFTKFLPAPKPSGKRRRGGPVDR